MAIIFGQLADRGSSRPTAYAAVVLLVLATSACGGAGSGSKAVTDPPSGLTYSVNPALYGVGIPVAPNVPTVGGGAVAMFTISPSLPPGLFLNPVNGHITGTPTTATPAITYTAGASNAVGSCTALLVIGVNDVPPAALVYSFQSSIYVKGAAIATNTPASVVGTNLTFDVSPSLPSGLTLDPSSGAITGTPSIISAARSYVVTARNTAGSTSATLSVTVNDVPPSALAYSLNQAIYTGGSTIAPNAPTSGGGAVISYSVSPSLPEGLTISTSTGVITGAPLVLADGIFLVTASNSGGQATASVSIKVVAPPAPTIQVQPSSQVVSPQQAATWSVSATGGGPLSYQWTRDGAPIAGATLVAYTLPSVGYSDSGAIFRVAVSDLFGGRAESSDALLTVQGFVATGALGKTRTAHTATLLPSGKVLVAGGYSDSLYLVTETAELYDPATGTWAGTGSMAATRADHTATRLHSGKVLVAGGMTGYRSTTVTATRTAEIFDASTGSWTTTGSLAVARYRATATLLASGKVLVAGGYLAGAPIASAEVYDPDTGEWTTVSPMTKARFGHVAALLPSGNVLVAGGTGSYCDVTAERYDEGTSSWVATGSLTDGRCILALVLLGTQKVLAVTVRGSDWGSTPSELYDEATGAWDLTGTPLRSRSHHSTTLLASGWVLVASGITSYGNGRDLTAELYDPASGMWKWTGSLWAARYDATATLLESGKVLLVGGQALDPLSSAELWSEGP